MTLYHKPHLMPVGDSALVVEFGDEISEQVNHKVHALSYVLGENPLPGLGEAVPTYRSLIVHYDPLRLSCDEVTALVTDLLGKCEEIPMPKPRVVEVPVVYGGEFGPDIEFVAKHNGLSVDEVASIHSSATYPVYMLGFSPGFPYFGGMPGKIATPRLKTPRTLVPAGSVGIAGEQTGVYPIATPGGWQIIGRSPLRLFDPLRDQPTTLHPGDRIHFVPIEPDRFTHLWEQEWQMQESQAAVEFAPDIPGLEVIQPGLLTTVQDLGRRGYERFGVPRSGAMDSFAMQAANILVGNPPESAGLEITILGPTLRATANCLIAVCGADLGLKVNEHPIPPWMSVFVRRGWQVEFSDPQNGCRAYLAVAGGIDLPPVMGSRSTYLRGSFGGLDGRALQAGDVLPVAAVDWHLAEKAARRLPHGLLPGYSDQITVDVILSPQAEGFLDESVAAFLSGEYQVSSAADRMGYRLQGPEVAHKGSADIISDGIVMGAIQVPADRQPIVMMADHQTTGGYLKIATVVSADIPLLAQCVPGKSTVRFRETSVEDARLRYQQMMMSLREFQDRLSD